MIAIMVLLVIVPVILNSLSNRRQDRLLTVLRHESSERVKGGRIYSYQRFNVVRYGVRCGRVEVTF